MATKIRAQVNLSREVVRQIDAVVGPRKRSEFLERAAVAQLRREALDRWVKLGEKFRGEVQGVNPGRRLPLFAQGTGGARWWIGWSSTLRL
jgi:hypothetical protein